MHATEPIRRLVRYNPVKNRDLYKASCVDRQYIPNFRKSIGNYETQLRRFIFRRFTLRQSRHYYEPLSSFKNTYDGYNGIYSWGQRKIIKRMINKMRR